MLDQKEREREMRESFGYGEKEMRDQGFEQKKEKKKGLKLTKLGKLHIRAPNFTHFSI